jgi:hypothetical protein
LLRRHSLTNDARPNMSSPCLSAGRTS